MPGLPSIKKPAPGFENSYSEPQEHAPGFRPGDPGFHDLEPGAHNLDEDKSAALRQTMSYSQAHAARKKAQP